ncbi:MAG: adenylate/guanylate cyclase domain-containing protein [Candidatus Tectomicrobia bacterium]|uniref:Adenylate/guanylate cyclase domain-containing protein n=1 Tax=Tectimicrobiota bacterium TaxID=2528274 RepID=A0A932MM50_UNCTE|nr:adenylate/guanylate cyclase domain-containing protein [Candidatus Tectomicrobia bacterium]
MEEKLPRRLSAIFSADVKGYSRLMGDDEEATVHTLTALRSTNFSIIKAFGGRVVDSPGDNMLVEFPSVVEAVKCAVEIQERLREANAELPSSRRMEFRIGINLGDVIADGDRIYGDGVNIAARLEGLAEGGGVCVSGTVFEQVESKLDLKWEFMGEQAVKNIARPVRAYRMRMGDGAGVEKSAEGARRDEPPRFSIFVLPLQNLSGNPDQDYFSDGITEDLITDLSRISGAFVISRSTSFAYKGKAVDAKQAAAELGVRYVLEGSVRRAGDQVRVNVQLIDAETGSHIWAERFDREVGDIFALQDEVTGRIARALNLQVLEAESHRAQKGRPENLDAEDYALRGWAELCTKPMSPESNHAAQKYLEEALRLDPDSARAWTCRSFMYIRAAQFGWLPEPRAELQKRAVEAGEKAISLDPKSAEAHYVLGLPLLLSGQGEKALPAFETAIEINRNYAPAYRGVGFSLTLLGRAGESFSWFEKAMRLSPRDPFWAVWCWNMGYAKHLIGEDKEAVAWAKRAIAANPKYPNSYFLLASAQAWLGEEEEARKALDEGRRFMPLYDTIALYRPLCALSLNETFLSQLEERHIAGLRKAGMPEA